MLIGFVVLIEHHGIPGPQLTQGRVQKFPPCSGTFPDKIEVIRTKEYRLKDIAEGSSVFRCNAVDCHFSPLAAVQRDIYLELPLSGFDLT